LKEEELIEPIKGLVSERPTYGYQRKGVLLRRRVKQKINHEKIYRLMNQRSLSLTRVPRKPTSNHKGFVVTDIHNQGWRLDALTIPYENGDAVNVVFSIDTCHR